FKKKKPEAETGQGPRLTANQFIALTLSDEKFTMPVYLPGIRSEAECGELGLWPLIYIWNVDRAAGRLCHVSYRWLRVYSHSRASTICG
ncbi:hypothetical protein ACLFAJ_19140, partial [Enterobacter mori]